MSAANDHRVGSVIAAALAFLVLCVAIGHAHACGRERWPIKVVSALPMGIYPMPMHTTIADLSAITAPANPDRYQSKRFSPTETTVFSLDAIMTVIKHEGDGDYHIVLRDGPATMIVEAPDPACAVNSHVRQVITAVRADIDRHFGSAIVRRRGGLSVPVSVSGIGFFDRLHGQEGVAKNGIELHPLLSIDFK
jgi:hypothetical protein